MGKGHRSRDTYERSEFLWPRSALNPAAILVKYRVTSVTLAVTIGHMNPTKPARIVWLSLLAFLVFFWIAIIWLAITVTETVVAMLEYVVELAQLY